VLFEAGILTTDAIGDVRAVNVLLAATDSAPTVRPGDILHAAIASGDEKIRRALSTGLVNGAQLSHVQQIIEVYRPPGAAPDFDGRRESFSPEALAALDEFDDALTRDRERLNGAGLELLLAIALSHLDKDDRKNLTILDPEAAGAALWELIRSATESLTPVFDGESGNLRKEEFTESAWAVLEHAGVHAAELGYDRILPPHALLALLGETEGLTEQLLRRQTRPDMGPPKIAAVIADGFRLADRTGTPVEPNRDRVGEAFVAVLRRAQRVARGWGAPLVDTPHLLAALLEDPPDRLVSLLERAPASLNLAKLRTHLDEALRDGRGTMAREFPFQLPTDLLPGEDLTWRARTGGIPPARHLDGYFDALTRALHRRTGNHVLITGARGVGTTTLLAELARRAAAGDIGFLARKRFLRVDCGLVGPAESAAKLTGLIAHLAGRTDVVLCVDGLGPMLRAGPNGDNKLVLLSALKEKRIHLIGVMDTRDYEELLSADQTLLEHVTRIDVAEPGRDAALEMAQDIAGALAHEFDLTIEPRAIERAVVLSADYILYERLPAKAAKILRQACEDLDYERSQGSDRTSVEIADVIGVVSRASGVPEGQLSGVGSDGIDYDTVLGEAVVGQNEAVAAVASELRLIKAGLRPGSVLFFAGLTGVGKTELAKALAQFYSASKRLQTYTMGNFTEGHAVSGIIGSPAGYIGHDRGGRLINDLNADPYCVVLLDEAEKAHPDVWKPFLNLFDEGWIDDQRGVRAFGDRAIFILTSNAGADEIARNANRPMAEIVKAVKDHLPTMRHRTTHEQVFPPEFLARIRKIIVFKPLDQAAMAGISRKMIARRARFWSEKREKQLVVPDRLVDYIAERSDRENAASGGKEGGRIVDKKISELIEEPITQEAERQPEAYLACRRIELSFVPPDPPLPGLPDPAARVVVAFPAPTPGDEP
jgi:ATP-dependent Clp protease ATP-binding subunit ClpA